MSMNENNDIEMTPEEKLEEVKRAINVKINTQKTLIAQERKKYREIDKLRQEDFPDKADRLKQCNERLVALQTQLEEFEEDKKDLNRTRDDETEEKIQAALHTVATEVLPENPSLAYIIKDKEFVNIVENSTVRNKQNVTIDKFDANSFVNVIGRQTGIKSWHLPTHRLIDLFNREERSFKYMKYSVDRQKWNKDVYQPMIHMEPYFIDKMTLTTEEDQEATASLEYFDWLMYSLSGGLKENQEHIERWIVHKIVNYDKAVTTPDIVIVGHVGGNGKGIIQAIIRIMLPAILSGKANSKTLNNNFNAIMLGKLIVFFDDQNSREIPLDVVKQLAGSETMIFEEKGKDQFEGEKTHSSAWFSQTLPFKLTPAGQEGGVDRRFSIMRTNITFLESIRKHMYEKTGEEVTVEESKDLAEAIVGNCLLNRVCIAKWFQTLVKKYPEINKDYVLKAHHGEDYRYFLDQQKDTFEDIFKNLVIPELENGNVVPVFVIREILRLNNETVPANRTLHKKMNEVASQNKLSIKTEKIMVNITNPDSTTFTMRTNVVRKKEDNANKPAFNWSLVSSKNFIQPLPGHPYIQETDFVFGTKNISDDDEDFLFEDLIKDEQEEDDEELVEERDPRVYKMREYLKSRK